MKTCPVCNAKAFDDAKICFECLHAFDERDDNPCRDSNAGGQSAQGSSEERSAVSAGNGAVPRDACFTLTWGSGQLALDIDSGQAAEVESAARASVQRIQGETAMRLSFDTREAENGSALLRFHPYGKPGVVFVPIEQGEEWSA